MKLLGPDFGCRAARSEGRKGDSAELFVSPVFVRELVTAPRRSRHYVARAVYVAALLMLMGTAWLVLAGTQLIQNIGDVSRFGAMLFQILAPLQLAIAIFFAALFTASSISQEKDRRTLVLLLMTDLSNFELVVGKLLSSLLNVLVLILAALPVFMGMLLLGGIDAVQVIKAFAVTIASAVAAGSLGSTIALWREKTFQALALTVLVLVAWLAAWEVVAYLPEGTSIAGVRSDALAVMTSPWRAVLEATRPGAAIGAAARFPMQPINAFLLLSIVASILLNTIAIRRVRAWNPSREVRRGLGRQRRADSAVQDETADAVTNTVLAAATVVPTAGQPSRSVWKFPVFWREVRTWAYGRKVLAIRISYLSLALFSLLGAQSMAAGAATTAIALPFFLIGLVLINAQAVTSVSTERDGKTLDLLLVTDLTPKEFVFGKLGGVLYNTKEMVLMPLVFCGLLWFRGTLSLENAIYVAGGLLVMDFFVAVLGLHCGLIAEWRSRRVWGLCFFCLSALALACESWSLLADLSGISWRRFWRLCWEAESGFTCRWERGMHRRRSFVRHLRARF